jgi:hypothetical protein
MKTTRVMLAATIAAAGGVLAGCEQPAPAITVFSGTNSVRASALCWAFDADALEPGQCARDIVTGESTGDAPALEVLPGNTVGISVDKSVAKEGWIVSIAGQQLLDRPITSTYFRFTFPNQQLPERGFALQVLAGGDQLRGVWAVRLVP